MTQSSLIVLVLLSVSTFAGDLEDGLALLSEGKFDEASRYIRRAYKQNPSDPPTWFAYAQILTSGTDAGSMYDSLARSKSVPDSLKAEALYRLGCLHYCNEEYKNAETAFIKAEKLNATSTISHGKVMAIFNRGDNRKAESIWLEMVSKGDDRQAVKKARYYLGNAFYQQGNYKEAYNCYNTAWEFSDEPWSVSARAGACLAAYHTGDTARSKEIYAELIKENPLLLEKDLLEALFTKSVSFSEEDIEDLGGRDDFGAVSGEPEVSVVKPVENKHGARYTLQVGAFSSVENARKLQKKMKKNFDHVTVVKEKIKGKEFHKVRIGRFTREDEALDYGNKHLKTRGYAFRVVKE